MIDDTILKQYLCKCEGGVGGCNSQIGNAGPDKDLVFSKIRYRILKILNIRDGGTGV